MSAHPSPFSPFVDRLTFRHLKVDSSRFQTSTEPVMVSVTLYRERCHYQPDVCEPRFWEFLRFLWPQQTELPTGIDGPEPTAIQGARPTAGQFLRMAWRVWRSAHTFPFSNFVPFGGHMAHAGAKHSQTPARPWPRLLLEQRTTGSRIVFTHHGSCGIVIPKSTELFTDPPRVWIEVPWTLSLFCHHFRQQLLGHASKLNFHPSRYFSSRKISTGQRRPQ